MFLSQYIDHTIKKIKSQVANILTIMNLSFGVCALLAVLRGEYQLSLLLIFIAALSDRFDGLVARKLNIESEFGKQLDSMCDIVSFGVAPALLTYQLVLFEYGAPGILFAIIYIICGAIRLSKFNITENNGYFTGLPITVAGIILTFSTLLVSVLPSYLFMYVIIGLALMMIGTFKLKKI
ncbi:CDP-diacylglycerol--serine O-phosphatidyltransferase [Schinkia azotoformans MEV2011]|uniref:CDP-diacylglycerol--serine O-phosphatidyltransferase n=1 Tax=Schinkia azotoformans MEV2011 TaxID=1348973 RepID=A0A072NY09_SCHAZ|nr:CDP-diacylglycerol--serine O-phosphatidyltransferase [Schinkia azotoformans]KEF38100.1 CDP-diacylglycerol--serine O-phosphatidyltransferase [Schinkia azotoformans MEV2011]MEC1696661.1 CDP-diacylglycerol--serine O-phosphatidyltransferase [Schinkia azotoformans]MEC1726135.1 CDP-diacylglycerol--serine O-phosphatidyltransferase [Schinkia azotoformans]MEC1781116.1 CDP-diacylglycerol--serine O-phosphatidyltransferase [Schinkia azotoformans]MED4329293.1 CDP-diacylglycerol--serine O-phosphatidyltra